MNRQPIATLLWKMYQLEVIPITQTDSANYLYLKIGEMSNCNYNYSFVPTKKNSLSFA